MAIVLLSQSLDGALVAAQLNHSISRRILSNLPTTHQYGP